VNPDDRTPDEELETIRRLLATIDHPLPSVDFATIVTRARARRRRAPLLVAGAGALLAAALAAALPSSPVRQLIVRALSRRGAAPSVQRAALPAGGSTIAIDVRSDAITRVIFRARQTAGVIRITRDSGHVLRIAELDGTTLGYAVTGRDQVIDLAAP